MMFIDFATLFRCHADYPTHYDDAIAICRRCHARAFAPPFYDLMTFDMAVAAYFHDDDAAFVMITMRHAISMLPRRHTCYYAMALIDAISLLEMPLMADAIAFADAYYGARYDYALMLLL